MTRRKLEYAPWTAFACLLALGCGSGARDNDASGSLAGQEVASEAPGAPRAPGTPGPRGGQGSGQVAPPRGHAWVIFGADTVDAEVARTADERSRGLQNRDHLAGGDGMLFVFSDAEIRSFWMKDTFIPLDIAYVDVDQRIVDIIAMEPESTALHSSSGPALFALEVPMGWFAEQGIEVGHRAEIVFGAS